MVRSSAGQFKSVFDSREKRGENVFVKGMLIKSIAISAVHDRG